MSFKREEFLAHLLRKRKRNARAYCAYLQRTEQEFKLDIDKEYRRDRLSALMKTLKARANETRRVDQKSSVSLRTMRHALRKYADFLKDNKYASPSAEIKEDKYSVVTDWSVKDTMVGTVRDGVQLKFLLKNKGYYVPANFISEDAFPIRFIALHEQGIGSEPGIRRYGEITSVQKIRRALIPVPMSRNNGDDLYWYFKIRRWEPLPRAIDIRDTSRGKPQFTSKFLLDRCTQSYQLFSVSSDDEYRLMTAVNTAFDDIRYSDYENFSAVYPINEALSLKVSDSCFTVEDDKGKSLEKISAGGFSYRPKESFNRFRKVIGK